MAMKTGTATFTGIAPLLQNNPQTVDRFNKYSRAMAAINAKKTRRTDDDYMELRDLEMRSKIHWSDGVGIVVPTTWFTAGVGAVSYRVAKLSKADSRAAIFADETIVPLVYRDMDKVKTPEDIVKSNKFRHMMTLKQGQVRVVKAVPIFHDWTFTVGFEFDDKMIDPGSLESIIKYAGKFGGFGDFRPTFGRAIAEVTFG